MAVDSRGGNGRPIFIGTGAPATADDLTQLGVEIYERGTVVVGTNAERAAYAYPVEGLGWRSTTDGLMYVYRSGAWTLVQYGVAVTTTTAQITDAAPGNWKAVLWDQETFDVGGMHDNAANTSRLLAPVAGIYWVSATLRLVTTSYAGGVALAVNGTVDQGTAVYAPQIGTFAAARPHTSKPFRLAAGQYVEVMSAGQAANLSLDLPGCSASMVRVS